MPRRDRLQEPVDPVNCRDAASLPLPLLPNTRSGIPPAPDAGLRAPGLQPGAGSSQHGLGKGEQVDLLSTDQRHAHRLEEAGRYGVPQRGLQRPAAADAAPSPDGVFQLLLQAGSVPDFQEEA